MSLASGAASTGKNAKDNGIGGGGIGNDGGGGESKNSSSNNNSKNTLGGSAGDFDGLSAGQLGGKANGNLEGQDGPATGETKESGSNTLVDKAKNALAAEFDDFKKDMSTVGEGITKGIESVTGLAATGDRSAAGLVSENDLSPTGAGANNDNVNQPSNPGSGNSGDNGNNDKPDIPKITEADLSAEKNKHKELFLGIDLTQTKKNNTLL